MELNSQDQMARMCQQVAEMKAAMEDFDLFIQKEKYTMWSWFSKLFKGTGHVIDEIGKKFLSLAKAGKLVEIAADGETIVSDGAVKVATLITDAGKLSVSVAKDDAVTLTALSALVTAAVKAGSDKLSSWTEDAALVAAVAAFLKSCDSANYTDVIAALKQIVTDAQAVGTTLSADFEELIKDCK